ncbi:hypothetical protein Cma02nite_02250 [Cellulomonas marina]|nr:hypothetical protein Cma02nite_02250 [Cellulomonas marina]
MLTEPGPQPTSRRRSPGESEGRRYAAEFSAVRQRCERSTLSWCPCVYTSEREGRGAWDGTGVDEGLGTGLGTTVVTRQGRRGQGGRFKNRDMASRMPGPEPS